MRHLVGVVVLVRAAPPRPLVGAGKGVDLGATKHQSRSLGAPSSCRGRPGSGLRAWLLLWVLGLVFLPGRPSSTTVPRLGCSTRRARPSTATPAASHLPRRQEDELRAGLTKQLIVLAHASLPSVASVAKRWAHFPSAVSRLGFGLGVEVAGCLPLADRVVPLGGLDRPNQAGAGLGQRCHLGRLDLVWELRRGTTLPVCCCPSASRQLVDEGHAALTNLPGRPSRRDHGGCWAHLIVPSRDVVASFHQISLCRTHAIHLIVTRYARPSPLVGSLAEAARSFHVTELIVGAASTSASASWLASAPCRPLDHIVCHPATSCSRLRGHLAPHAPTTLPSAF